MTFQTYPQNPKVIDRYVAYQSKYATNARESDKVFISLLRNMNATGSLLDIGCSTGNLLKLIAAELPHLALTGGDYSEQQIDQCKTDPSLQNITFKRMSITQLNNERDFDFVVTSATLYAFDDYGFQKSAEAIWKALKPGGTLISFDYYHPFPQDLAIIEKSDLFPLGNPLHFRSYASTGKTLQHVGFGKVEFQAFDIPIDLPFDPGKPIQTHTDALTNGKRVMFRGALSQPWCHLIATKR